MSEAIRGGLAFDMAQAPPPASNLRPLIAAARAALSAAAAEPPLGELPADPPDPASGG